LLIREARRKVLLVPLGFTEGISYTHDNCKYYYSPSSTDNNAAYHIDRLTKNSVSIPCHKVVTAEDVDSSLPSGMIQDLPAKAERFT